MRISLLSNSWRILIQAFSSPILNNDPPAVGAADCKFLHANMYMYMPQIYAYASSFSPVIMLDLIYI